MSLITAFLMLLWLPYIYFFAKSAYLTTVEDEGTFYEGYDDVADTDYFNTWTIDMKYVFLLYCVQTMIYVLLALFVIYHANKDGRQSYQIIAFKGGQIGWLGVGCLSLVVFYLLSNLAISTNKNHSNGLYILLGYSILPRVMEFVLVFSMIHFLCPH